jgi:hypothetical protein
MTKGFALTLVAILCLAGQTPADEVVPTAPAPAQTQVETMPEGTVSGPIVEEPSISQPPASLDDARWWFSTDYLAAWVRGSLLQPLVTTSPKGTKLTSAGVLGKKTTGILFGNGRFNDDMRNGIKFGAGGWFDAERTFGMDVGFFMLESQNTLFFAASNGNPILARPFFNVSSFKQDSQIVAFPGVATGSIGVSLRSNNFYSGHLDLQEVFLERSYMRLESIVGYRFLRFDERLEVFQNLNSLGGGVIAAGTNIQTLDNFTVKNELNAADLGFRAEFFDERWSLDLVAKMAVGRIHREAIINGLTETTVPGTNTVTSTGGMLALVSNIGQHNTNDWIVVPDLGVNLGWNITPRLRLHLGYDVLFWNNVSRASDEVSLLINPNLFPPQRPASPFLPLFSLVRTDMWVQALNVGLEFRY